MRHLACTLPTAILTLALSAGPITYTTPNLDPTPVGATKSVSFAGATYLNKGLVGVGNFPASAVDGLGDTLGSFSSFKVDPATWRKHADGSYSGTLYTLPDRGYNRASLIDYAARVQTFDLVFRPDYTTQVVGQTQLTLTFKGTTKLTDFNGQPTTAVNPTGTTLGGLTNVPVANGKLTLDTEGLAIARDGSFYVSDEYGAAILHVDRDGRLLGKISPVQALIPRFTEASGLTGYNTQVKGVDISKATDPMVQTGGRRDNQGWEAIDVTPDGRYLVAMLQSATRQDTIGNLEVNRAYTRLIVYDISHHPTPAAPIGHYLVELPTVSEAGVGATANKTAAQSELVALDRNTFLVLTRDSNGNGSGNAAYDANAAHAAVGHARSPIVFKSVALVSTANATNLIGTPCESGYAPAVTGSGPTLAPAAGIVAARTTDFVNLLNVNQLARFGLNLNTIGASGVATAAAAGRILPAADANSLSEKWEALAVVPCLDEAHPDDYFLLIGNDNDFLTSAGMMLGKAYNGLSAVAGQETVESPNRILVYRVKLPGYVRPAAPR